MIEKSRKVNESQFDFLKPCPFCGGGPEIKTEINIHPIRSYAVHTIKCTKCPCSITVADVTEDEVARLWNRRVKE